jgi:hypothetical protein
VLGQRGDLRDQMIDAVLRAGLRFGFIASSDGHGLLFHHGVGRKRDPFRTGLCAVQATGCDRQAILSALRERRCYATSGVKIALDLRAGAAPMGSELTTKGNFAVNAVAAGTAPLAELALVDPEGVIASEHPKGDEVALELRAEIHAPYVYARATQRDGEMAWSSPIWNG